MRISMLSLIAITSVCACSSDPAPRAEEHGPDAVYSAGPFAVNPGEDKTICSYVRGTNEEAADIAAFITDQSEGGHHVIVYAVDHPIDLPPHVCTQGGQPSWDTLLVSQQQHEELRFPTGVGYRVGPKQQYVIETHYINASGAPLDVGSRFGVVYAEPGSVRERAATYYFGTMNIDVPAAGSARSSGACSPPIPMKVRTMLGHQHAAGTSLDVQLIPGDGSEPVDLYRSTTWDAAPLGRWDEGIEVGVDDRLAVNCEWSNASTDPLRFPSEMCFAIGYYWPADTSFTCASGGGGPSDQCTCFARGNLDVGPGGGTADVVVRRAAEVPGAAGPLDAGDAIYCFFYAPSDFGPTGPKSLGARPLYFRDAQGVVLDSAAAEATITFGDVTPGSYVASCLMDTVGGGFIVGSGDVVNATPVVVTVEPGTPARADVVLDFAIP